MRERKSGAGAGVVPEQVGSLKAESLKGNVPAPNFQYVKFKITGDAPMVQNKFSQEARDLMRYQQEHPEEKKRGKKRVPKDFDAGYQGAMHKMKGGGYGIPASVFRQAMVSACRLVGFKMTIAKLAVFVVADGVDDDDGAPLVKITKGDPYRKDSYVRNDNGSADIRPRPFWNPGWEAIVHVRFDGDIFEAQDIHNLMARVGIQVGIGAGRPDSKTSCGQGWGTFTVEEVKA
jgi:hypothetical protein